MHPPGHKYANTLEMAADMERLLVEGRCGLCHEQMPGMLVNGDEPDDEKAVIGGFVSLRSRSTGDRMMWLCGPCAERIGVNDE